MKNLFLLHDQTLAIDYGIERERLAIEIAKEK